MRARLQSLTPAQSLRLGALLLVAGIVIFVLRDGIRATLIEPLAFLIWSAGILLDTVPQTALLGLLVLIGALAALRALVGALGPPAHPQRFIGPEYETTKLQFWQRTLAKSIDSRYAAERSVIELRTMLLSTLAANHSLTQNDVIARVGLGTLSLPPDARSLVSNHYAWLALCEVPNDSRDALPESVRDRAFATRKRNHPNNTVLLQKIEAVVQYLETTF